jgi:hypothetical protein
MYVPIEQAPNVEGTPTIVPRTSLADGAAVTELRGIVSAKDWAVPLDHVGTMDQLVSGLVSPATLPHGHTRRFSILHWPWLQSEFTV